MGFVINPYDMCVASKTINGKQCTIVWYVDDLKVSYEIQKYGRGHLIEYSFHIWKAK